MFPLVEMGREGKQPGRPGSPSRQELPDWHGPSTTASGRLTPEAVGEVAKRMRHVFSTKRAATKVGGKFLQDMRQKKLANKYHLLATDHAFLTGTGLLGLVTFQAAQPCAPLAAGCRRFYIAGESLPENLRSELRGRSRRSCLLLPDGSTRLEVIWSQSRPRLFEVLDQGSIGWPSRFGLFDIGRGRLRGFWDCDVPHRVHNNTLLALNMCGLKAAKLESLLICCLSSGPWDSASWFGSISEAAAEYFENHTWESELFQQYYGQIAWERSEGVLPHEFGTEEHMQLTYEQARQADVLLKKMSKPAEGRWFQCFSRPVSHESSWGVLCMVLTYMGSVVGWLHDPLRQVALPGETGRPTETPGGGGAPSIGTAAVPDTVGKAPMKQSSSELNELRAMCNNTVHVCWYLLHKKELRATWMCITAATMPVMKGHSEFLVQSKTIRGTRHWCTWMAASGYFSTIREIFGALHDRTTLVKAGLMKCSEASSPFLLSRHQAASLAETLFVYVLNLCGLQLQWAMRYSHTPPFMFAGLLDPAGRRSTLKRLEVMWAVLLALEEAMQGAGQGNLRALHSSLLWPSSTWTREVFIALSECNFIDVPDDILLEVTEFTETVKTTKMIEDCFNLLRDRSRHHKAGTLGSTLRFSTLISSTMQRDWDRKEWTPPSPIEYIPPVPPTIFTAKAHQEFSMGLPYLGQVSSSAKDMGTLAYLQTALAWQSVEACGLNFAAMDRAWLSLMASPGDLIRNDVRQPPCMGLVLCSCPHGVLCVEVKKLRQTQGVLVVDVEKLSTEGEFKFWVLHDPDDWLTVQAQPHPPQWAEDKGHLELAAAGVTVLIPPGDPVPLPKIAANEAFKNMTVLQVSALIAAYDIPYTGKKPTMEVEVFPLVMKFFLPDFSDEDIAELVAARRKKRSSEASGGTVLCDELVKLARKEGLGHTDFVQSLDEAPFFLPTWMTPE